MAVNLEGTETVHFTIHSDIDLDIAVLKTLQLPMTNVFCIADRALIATIVSELGHNILKYARRGSIRLNTLKLGDRIGVEVIALDHGPGIPNLDDAMRDHFSSGGTLGLGLPGVKRMADEFMIESEPKRGTRVVVRKWTRRLP